MKIDKLQGVSGFYRDKNSDIYHTYSSYARGLDMLVGAYNFLDLAPKGRQEDWEEPPGRSDGPFMRWGFLDILISIVVADPVAARERITEHASLRRKRLERHGWGVVEARKGSANVDFGLRQRLSDNNGP